MSNKNNSDNQNIKKCWVKTQPTNYELLLLLYEFRIDK
jgi:hypothetical protein